MAEPFWQPGGAGYRRSRRPGAGHLVVAGGPVSVSIEVETERARFLGRGRGVRDAAAMGGTALSNTVGTGPDAFFALRCGVTVAPGAVVRVALWTMAAGSCDALASAMEKHRDAAAFDRASTLAWTLAWTQAQVQLQLQLRHLSIRPAAADPFHRLAGHRVSAGPAVRPGSDAIRRGARQALDARHLG